MNVEEIVGKRMLLKLGGNRAWGKDGEVQEFRVLEVAPSANWIRLMNTNGYKFWTMVGHVAVVEELKPLKLDKPREGMAHGAA